MRPVTSSYRHRHRVCPSQGSSYREVGAAPPGIDPEGRSGVFEDRSVATMATSKKVEKDEATVDAKAGGAAAGGTAGAVIGGLAGGPVGAGVGAVAGAAAGGLAGSAVDYDSVEPEFRRHWESGEYSKSHQWEQA